jgi:hypothetical protein
VREREDNPPLVLRGKRYLHTHLRLPVGEKGNKLALSEVKVGKSVKTSEAIGQLTNAMNKLKDLNLAGDVERVELIIKKGHNLDEDFGILNGYLVRPSKGNELVTIKGFKNLIMVIAL